VDGQQRLHGVAGIAGRNRAGAVDRGRRVAKPAYWRERRYGSARVAVRHGLGAQRKRVVRQLSRERRAFTLGGLIGLLFAY